MAGASWTFTITLHLWWLWAYLAVGCVAFLPLSWLAWRHTTRGHETFRGYLGRGRHWYTELALIALWPAALWEEVR